MRKKVKALNESLTASARQVSSSRAVCSFSLSTRADFPLSTTPFHHFRRLRPVMEYSKDTRYFATKINNHQRNGKKENDLRTATRFSRSPCLLNVITSAPLILIGSSYKKTLLTELGQTEKYTKQPTSSFFGGALPLRNREPPPRVNPTGDSVAGDEFLFETAAGGATVFAGCLFTCCCCCG